MVARGDLGTEIPAWKVFIAQKAMISKCNIAGKPVNLSILILKVIVATQMMQSMTDCPKPTRAEASDVANAVLDGADCVMLSAETASGKYPVESITVMAKICLEAEAIQTHSPFFNELKGLTPKPLRTTETVAVSAVNASLEEGANLIIVLSTTG
jgi:pyruvate kinase